MRTALYVRTSTEYQANGLDSQQRALENYCLAKGISDFLVFRDFGVSGSKLSRPGLDQMMQSVRDGDISAVVVYSFSRFARSTKALITALDEFKTLDVSFISMTENIDTRTPMGRTMFSIIASLAELERALVQERVVNGLKAAKARGQRLGREKQVNSAVIIELAAQGLPQRKIAQLVGCSKTTVQREIKSSGPKSTKQAG